MKTLISLLALLSFSISCTQAPRCGDVKKYVIDMGSSVTKHKIAVVDTCKMQEKKEILNEGREYSLGHYLTLKYKKKDFFDLEDEDMQVVSEEIKLIKDNIKKYKIQETKILATSVYRKIKNLDKLEKAFGKSKLDFKVISNVEELEYTRLAVDRWLKDTKDYSNINYVTWSIGGQSTFLSYVNAAKLVEFQYYADWGSYNNLQYAQKNGFSVEALITEDDKTKNESIDKLIKAMDKKVQKDHKLTFLKELIKDKGPLFIGVGGVHKNSALKNISKSQNHYKTIKLEDFLKTGMVWNKLDLNSQFGTHLIPNLTYLFAIAKALGVEKVLVLNTNFKDYMLVN